MTDCIKTDPEAMDFRRLMLTEPYNFLRTDEHLGRRIALLGLGGSYAYGTNNENSDVDFRGIELLGLDEDQYLVCTEIGREILEHKSLFLSKRAARSFGGYASAQLRRLQNAIARDSVPQQERERHIMNSAKNAWEDMQQKCRAFDRGTLRIYIDQAENPQLETEIFIDADYKHLPLRDYKDMLVSMNNVIREYDKVGKRNHKKDDDHLNKHAMHLIRLYMMAIDILEKGEIRTHRTQAGDLDLLLSIRRGEFMSEPGVLSDDFYRILSEYEQRMEHAIRVSCLPDEPDMEQVAAFVESVNRRAVEENYY
ncbi:MAG: nucleotidyltransferase [Clostridiales bacterium]|nr:nucleotidyltransferase [Clostridiales bacterium]